MGRRYATYDKNFALSLFYASPKAYRFCTKLFCLQNVTMLRLWLRRLHVKLGFYDNVFDMLKHVYISDVPDIRPDSQKFQQLLNCLFPPFLWV